MYHIKIPLHSQSHFKFYEKSFQNILDVITHLEEILEDKVKINDCWNDSIKKAIYYKWIIDNDQEDNLSPEHLKELDNNYNQRKVINELFLNCVKY